MGSDSSFYLVLDLVSDGMHMLKAAMLLDMVATFAAVRLSHCQTVHEYVSKYCPIWTQMDSLCTSSVKFELVT